MAKSAASKRRLYYQGCFFYGKSEVKAGRAPNTIHYENLVFYTKDIPRGSQINMETQELMFPIDLVDEVEDVKVVKKKKSKNAYLVTNSTEVFLNEQ